MKKTIYFLIIIFIGASGCKDVEHNEKNEKDKIGQQSNDQFNINSQISTFFTFQENNAEEAMNFYVGLFENSKITNIQRYGKGGPAKEGTIMAASFVLNGKKFICSDSYITHEWTFTPAVSNWVDCRNEQELNKLFEQLSDNGKVLMPIDNYGFSEKFTFVEDRFGISWQLNLQ